MSVLFFLAAAVVFAVRTFSGHFFEDPVRDLSLGLLFVSLGLLLSGSTVVNFWNKVRE